MRYGSQSSSDGARFRITIRALLFSCASFCYMPRWNHTSSNGNIHRKSTLERKTDVLSFKLRSLGARNQPGVPELATELNAVPSTKADGHPIWRWSFLPDWSAAQRAQLSPTRYTHTHTQATHAHTHSREELSPWNGRYCVNGCQLWTTVFLFLRRGISCAVGKEKTWVRAIFKQWKKKMLRVQLEISKRLTSIL